jgi:hypothetical protein
LENSSTIKNICVFLYTFDNSSACIMWTRAGKHGNWDWKILVWTVRVLTCSADDLLLQSYNSDVVTSKDGNFIHEADYPRISDPLGTSMKDRWCRWI